MITLSVSAVWLWCVWQFERGLITTIQHYLSCHIPVHSEQLQSHGFEQPLGAAGFLRREGSSEQFLRMIGTLRRIISRMTWSLFPEWRNLKRALESAQHDLLLAIAAPGTDCACCFALTVQDSQAVSCRESMMTSDRYCACVLSFKWLIIVICSCCCSYSVAKREPAGVRASWNNLKNANSQVSDFVSSSHNGFSSGRRRPLHTWWALQLGLAIRFTCMV